MIQNEVANYMKCPSCDETMTPIIGMVRQHVGCPTSCGGSMAKQTVGKKCSKCGTYISINSD